MASAFAAPPPPLTPAPPPSSLFSRLWRDCAAAIPEGALSDPARGPPGARSASRASRARADCLHYPARADRGPARDGCREVPEKKQLHIEHSPLPQTFRGRPEESPWESELCVVHSGPWT